MTRRGALVAASVLLAVALAVYGDLLVTRGRVVSGLGTDLSLQFVFWRDFGFREMRHGNLPLWNPHVYSGMPFHGGMQPALLYPPNWIHLVLPLDVALNVEVALHTFLLGLFTALWVGARGVGLGGALLAGTIAMLGGATFGHVYAGHLSLLAATAWTPLVFLAVDRLAGGAWRGAAVVGVPAVALQFLAGHPQTVYVSAIAAALLLALAVVVAARPSRATSDSQADVGLPARASAARLAGAVSALAAIYAGGALLAAAQILPGLDAAEEGLRTRGGLSSAEAAVFSLPLENLLTLVVAKPFGFGLAPGGPSAPAYWGRWYSWEMTPFVGVAGFFLAALGAFAGDRRARRGAAPAALALLVLALGASTPLFALLHGVISGFGAFRGPSKFAIPASLLLALLAGVGLDRLMRGEGDDSNARDDGAAVRKRRVSPLAWPLLGAAALLAALGLAARASAAADGLVGRLVARFAAGGASYLPSESVGDAAFIAQAARHAALGAWAAAGVALVAAAALAAWPARRAARLIAALALAELLLFARGTRPTFALEPVLHPPSLVAFRASHASDDRVLHAQGEDNALAANGLLGVWGYDPNVGRRYAEFMYFTQSLDPDRAGYNLRFTAYHPLHRMLRLRYLVSSRAGAGVREFEPPLPRAFLVGTCVVARGRDAVFSALAAPSFDPDSTVVLESAPEPAPEPRANLADPAGSVRVTDLSTDAILVEAETDRPAILVLTDAYGAGWRAVALPGSAQSAYRVVPANYVLRAVPLAAGRHRLRLEYAPRGYRIGKWVSLAALGGFAVLGTFGIVAARARRR